MESQHGKSNKRMVIGLLEEFVNSKISRAYVLCLCFSFVPLLTILFFSCFHHSRFYVQRSTLPIPGYKPSKPTNSHVVMWNWVDKQNGTCVCVCDEHCQPHKKKTLNRCGMRVGVLDYSVAVCTSAVPGYNANVAAALHLVRATNRRQIKLTDADWQVTKRKTKEYHTVFLFFQKMETSYNREQTRADLCKRINCALDTDMLRNSNFEKDEVVFDSSIFFEEENPNVFFLSIFSGWNWNKN